MVYTPQDTAIAKHIDYYWIVDNATAVLGNHNYLHAYPGVTPDMIIVIDGYYEFSYLGQKIKQSKSRLFSFIHKEVLLNLGTLQSFILVKFKSRALGAIQPFVSYTAAEIMKNPVGFSTAAFGGSIEMLSTWLHGKTPLEMVAFLDNWFLSYYHPEREGFVVEMAEEVSAQFDLPTIMENTGYSYATIERYFKRETGLTPKKYQSLRRCKQAVTEICSTKNDDWMHYVNNYGYYDQSHFVKDIKRYTKFTPSQLIAAPSFVAYRPAL